MIALFFATYLGFESSAWARAGGGGSSGSRGSRSFSSPSMPPAMSPPSSPGVSPGFSGPGMGYGRSPFWSGLAGGVMGGFIGNMLFGGRVYGGPMGYGGGPGLLDVLIIGALIYFGYRYFIRRRGEQSTYYEQGRSDEYGVTYYGDGRGLPLGRTISKGAWRRSGDLIPHSA